MCFSVNLCAQSTSIYIVHCRMSVWSFLEGRGISPATTDKMKRDKVSMIKRFESLVHIRVHRANMSLDCVYFYIYSLYGPKTLSQVMTLLHFRSLNV